MRRTQRCVRSRAMPRPRRTRDSRRARARRSPRARTRSPRAPLHAPPAIAPAIDRARAQQVREQRDLGVAEAAVHPERAAASAPSPGRRSGTGSRTRSRAPRPDAPATANSECSGRRCAGGGSGIGGVSASDTANSSGEPRRGEKGRVPAEPGGQQQQPAAREREPDAIRRRAHGVAGPRVRDRPGRSCSRRSRCPGSRTRCSTSRALSTSAVPIGFGGQRTRHARAHAAIAISAARIHPGARRSAPRAATRAASPSMRSRAREQPDLGEWDAVAAEVHGRGRADRRPSGSPRSRRRGPRPRADGAGPLPPPKQLG